MKMRAGTALCAAAAAVTAGLLILGTSWAQETRSEPRQDRYGPRAAEMIMNKFGNEPFEFRQKFNVLMHHPEAMGAIREAAEQLRDAEGDDERETAKDKLSKLLDEFFEHDMQHRAEELAKIEERVKKLHSLMERRAAKKQEIIDLQIKVLENEADGLGFFSEPGPPMMDSILGIPQKEWTLQNRQRIPAGPGFGPPAPPQPPRAGAAPSPRRPGPPVNQRPPK